MTTPSASPRSYGMKEWTRQNWMLVAWYTWLAMLACGVVYFLLG